MRYPLPLIPFSRLGLIGALLVTGSAASTQHADADSRLSQRERTGINANVTVTASGKDATCTRGDTSKPCATLLRAYQVAKCGDLVTIKSGTYPSQHLGAYTSSQNTDAKDCSSDRNPIVFKGESPASVSIDGVAVGEPWVTLANLTTSALVIVGWDSTVGCYTNPVSHVKVSGLVVDARGTRGNPMYMANVQYVTLSATSIGNVGTGETEISNAGAAPCPHNDHLMFDGNTWHDFLNPGGANDHMECLQLDSLTSGTSNDNVTLRNNRFLNCGQFDVYISGPMNNWTIQNNYFDAPCSNQAGTSCLVGGGAISFSADYVNVLGQFNVFAPGTYPQFSLVAGSQSGGTWRYNINGTFPDTYHCGGQNKWTLTSNIDSGSAVCGSDTNVVGRPRLQFLTSSYHGRSLQAIYGLVSEKALTVRLTVYSGRSKLAVSTPTQRVGIYNSPARFAWPNPSKKRPSRLCGRAYDESGNSVAVGCTAITG